MFGGGAETRPTQGEIISSRESARPGEGKTGSAHTAHRARRGSLP